MFGCVSSDATLFGIIITIISLVGSTAITTIVGLIIKKQFEKYAKTKEEAEANKEKLALIEKEKDRQARKQDVLDSVSTLLEPIKEDIQELKEHQKANVKSSVVTNRCLMKHDMDDYVRKGFATDSEKASWNEMLAVYRENGGNHFKEYVNQWEKTVNELPSSLKNNKKSVTKGAAKIQKKAK